MPARGAPWGREDGTCSAAVLSSGSTHTRGVIEDTDFSARQSSSTSLPQGLGLCLSFPISVVGTLMVPTSPGCSENLTQSKHSARDFCVSYFNISLRVIFTLSASW